MGIDGVNLRQELERSAGTIEATPRVGRASPALRMLLLVGLALLTTVALGGTLESRAPLPLAGAFAVNLLLVGIMDAALRVFRPTVYASGRTVILLAGLVAVLLGAATLTTSWRPGVPELVPIAFVGIVIGALFDRRMSLLTVLLLTVLLAAQPAFRTHSALPVLMGAGASAALAVRPTNRRDQSYLWILIICTVATLSTLASGIATEAPRLALIASAIRAASTAVVSVIGAMLFLPLAERFTGRETHRTLIEWGDLHHPLLQRLSLEAPGTYAHTIAIANMAEAACRAIGANPLLARVGAYYHDIGKLARPQYYVENQLRGRNPHDKLKPSTSAAIIRNHVREGLVLADEIGLPAAIRAFITEHHGTNTIAYFLERARERDATPPNVSEYTYPGPIPQSAETAVVMLADGAEAAARALSDPTPERVREVVERMIRQRLDQGQLRDAPVTLRNLTAVTTEFVRVLGGMYHARVEYPTPVGSSPARV
jgi:putative nucleotidyltransferase with HDIG domain